MQARQAKTAGDSSDQTLYTADELANSALAPTAVRNPCSLNRIALQVTVPRRAYSSGSCTFPTSSRLTRSLTWRPWQITKPLSHDRDVLLGQFVPGRQSLFLHHRTMLA